jgi:DAK2 domain fusion protein YloV
MSNKEINGLLFKKIVTNGAIKLKNHYKEIDHLNVFPVPDGDTGTNMQMTMMSGVKEIKISNSESIVEISKALSRGLLMGARGNSGVILSQFFRGIYSGLSKLEKNFATVSEFIDALVSGYQMAYRAVMEPVEGTILTVVRESAERVLRDKEKFNSIKDVLECYLTQANITLEKTPELLPVLKEAGVVDSGGAGLIKIVEGMILALEDKILNENEKIEESSDYHGAHNLGEVEITYGYCTEFIIKLRDHEKFNQSDLRDPLTKLGDSLVFVQDEDLLKVHIHTDEPGIAITLGQKYGDLQTLKADNMRLQNQEILSKKDEPTKELKDYAILSVCSGEGIKQIFKDLGVDNVIDGGQSMNPSTEDFIKSIEKVFANNIIIFPNNKNIIMSAKQTQELLPEKNIHVVETKSISQGYAAMIAFDPTMKINENLDVMNEVIENMSYGSITSSIRDTNLDGLEIKKDDYISLLNGKIISSNSDLTETGKVLLKKMIKPDSEILTIFVGNNTNKKTLETFKTYVRTFNSDIEIESIDGKQNIYFYLFAVE